MMEIAGNSKCSCGMVMDVNDSHCPQCGYPNNQYIAPPEMKVFEAACEKYGLKKDEILEEVASKDYLDLIDDNCIIYNNGIIDSFDRPDQLLTSLRGEVTEFNNMMSEAYDDIYIIIFNGKKADFISSDRIDFFRPESKIKIEDILRPDQILGLPCIITLKDVPRTVLKFAAPDKLAEWINRNGGEDIAMIFINGEYFDYEVVEMFKLNSIEIEIPNEFSLCD